MDDMLAMYDRGISHTAAVIDGVGDDQWGNTAPCEGWTAKDVANHTVGGLLMFKSAIDGSPLAGGPDSDALGADPKGAYHAAAEAGAKAWRSEGLAERTLKLPFGEMPAPMVLGIAFLEVLTHGLDLAVATGQEDKLDQALCEQVLGMAKEMGVDNFRVPGVFGPAVEIADDAPANRRLLAYLGRPVA